MASNLFPHFRLNFTRAIANALPGTQWKRLKASRKSDHKPAREQERGRSREALQPTVVVDVDDQHEGHSAACSEFGDPLNLSGQQRKLRRRGSVASNISDIYGNLIPTTSTAQARQRSQDRRSDPLGLTVLYSPDPEPRTVDIMFIHGLGGTSLRTWCRNRDPDFLWPKHWLPDEADFSTARIMTYGYNAHFSSKKEQTSMTLNDFANDLLFRMRYDEETEERLGQVPIVFVAHSMGGLVFKKACKLNRLYASYCHLSDFILVIHGQANEEYKDIISKVKAVLFLGTPHRGTDLADILNKVLSSSMFGHSPKDYVQELTKRSPTIDEMNEQFRHHASKLKIFSFYETLTTTVGPVKTLILEKQSSVLGYQHETPQPLVANHHDVCKFSSPDDPNYQSVKGALRSIVNTIRCSNEHKCEQYYDLSTLRKWLSVPGAPEDDLAGVRASRKPGTCQTILADPDFGKWLDSEFRGPQLLWLHAPPGSGKTFQSSFVIDHLQEHQTKCAYWFFQYKDTRKRSTSHMLRSIAYQISAQDPSYRKALMEIQRSGMKLTNGDVQSVWRNAFATKLSKCQTRWYWVIDGLDEADSSRIIPDLLSGLNGLKVEVRILIVSRKLSTIRNSIQRLRKRAPDFAVNEMALVENLNDIRIAAADEMEDFPGDEGFKHEVVDQIVSRSEGNFLWSSLVLKKVLQSHRQGDVKKVLDSVPTGMDQLYDRMITSIAALDSEEDRHLSKILLCWAMYAVKPVTIDELMDPYSVVMSSIIDIKHSTSQLCAEFATLDRQNRIILVHQTAREYLRKSTKLPFSLESASVNEDLMGQCLSSLCDPGLRGKIRQDKTPKFATYAAIAWHVHLDQVSAESDTALQMLVKFFHDSPALAWIQFLAASDDLAVLVAASLSLSTFVRRRRKAESSKPPTIHRIPELALLETWAVDLLKMTAKVGSYLREDPEAIYKYVPALSPRNSILFKEHAGRSSSRIQVSGLHSNTDWDDCLARVSNGSDTSLHVAVSDQQLAVANDSPHGRIRLWDNVLFQELPSFVAGEPICALAFSASGSLLACHGLDHTYVWKTDGKLLAKVKIPYQERAETMTFTGQEESLIIATNHRRVYRLALNDGDNNKEQQSWLGYDASLLEETSIPEGAFINSPSSLAFSPDGTQLAVAYRSFPLAIWTLDPPAMLARCSRRQRQFQSHSSNLGWTGVTRVVWHPFGGYILGIYRDGQIFKWSPMDDTHEEVKQELDATPSDIICSPNGLLFATSDIRGTIKIYDFAHMTLIYKLTSDNDIIKAIAFGADSKRFYDLRGTYCNVWEPNCLIRLATSGSGVTSDRESITSSEFLEKKNGVGGATSVFDLEDTRSTMTTLTAMEAHADSKPAITAVATCRKNSRLVLYAKDDGIVELQDTGRREAKKAHVLATSAYGMPVDMIALSPRGTLAAYSMFGGRFTIKSVKVSLKSGKITTKEVFSEKADVGLGVIKQVLFHEDKAKALICGTARVEILDLGGRDEVSLVASAKVLDNDGNVSSGRPLARWEIHPTDQDTILAITATSVEAYSWDDLTEPRYSIPIDLSLPPTATPHYLPSELSQITITEIIPSPAGKIHLALLSFEQGNTQLESFLLLDTSALHDFSPSSSPKTISALPSPEKVMERIEQPVGFLADGRLVFMDEALWVCTMRLEKGDAKGFSTRRHFFLPRDWLSSGGVGLCRVQSEGAAFLCPSKGELAVIMGDLGINWGV